MKLSRAIVVLSVSGLIPNRAYPSSSTLLPAPVRRVTQRITQVTGKRILVARAKTKLALDRTERCVAYAAPMRRSACAMIKGSSA